MPPKMIRTIRIWDEKKNFCIFSGSRFLRIFVIISSYFARVIAKCRLPLLIFALLSQTALAIEVKPSFPLAIRTGENHCWVKASMENGVICIPKDLWLKDFELQITPFSIEALTQQWFSPVLI